MPARQTTLGQMCIAEALGTFMLVFFGVGAVHAAVLSGAQSGLWQVAVVWGLAIMLAIFVTGAISGAHINPAMTLAFAAWGRCPWHRVGPYIASQMVGAFAAAAILFVLWQPWIVDKEEANKVIRGEPRSVITAMCYGEYFPNPDIKGSADRVSESTAMIAEMLGTALLALVVFAVTDNRNGCAPPTRMEPVFIGLTVSALISVIAPLTQACFNPARDFGPRLFAYFAGWGSVAIPGQTPTGFFTVYILSPIVGALVGGGLYTYVIRPALPDSK